ncbi:hypothetical protein HY990_03785 [Candidatus Micrarchaeota archaeon]|nr:hypothetical protein [Candidatus Micrarchaeota archaeon]
MSQNPVVTLKGSQNIFETARRLNEAAREQSGSKASAKFLAYHRKRVEDVARRSNRGSAFILGAGNCTEFDLAFMADYFGRIVISDLDIEAPKRVLEEVSSATRSKVRLVKVDINGSVEQAVKDAERAIDHATSAEQAVSVAGMVLNLSEITTGEDPQHFDFIYSANVAPSIAFTVLMHLYAKIIDRFPDAPDFWTLYDKADQFVGAMPLLHLVKLGAHFGTESQGYINSTAARCHFGHNPEKPQIVVPILFDTNERGEMTSASIHFLGHMPEMPQVPNSILRIWQASARHSGLSMARFGIHQVLEEELPDGGFEGMIYETAELRKLDRPRFMCPEEPEQVFMP